MCNVLLFILAVFCAPLCFSAEVYPSKPVRMIVSFQHGSGTDLSARTISQQLTKQLGKSFFVENLPGASGIIGNDIVAKSAPDGHTLLMAEPSFAIVPSLKKSLPYDAVKDFIPITLIMRNASALVVNASLKANTVKELIALAQANPGKFNFGSAGIGSNSHMNGELFKMMAKVNMVHIPYKGSGQTVAGIIGNEIQMLITGIPTALSAAKSGKVRVLAVTTDGTRWPAMPDVPSISEAGVPGMALYTWYGLIGPAGMPREVVNKLNAEAVKALAVPSVKAALIAGGGELVGSSQEEFSTYIRSEMQRWAQVIKSAGITAE